MREQEKRELIDELMQITREFSRTPLMRGHLRQLIDTACHPQDHPASRPAKVTIQDAPQFLDATGQEMWVIGWNECVDAFGHASPD